MRLMHLVLSGLLAWQLSLPVRGHIAIYEALVFVMLWLVFGRVDKDRVPLYLSSRLACECLEQQLPKTAKCWVDLGCGNGQVVAWMATRHPEVSFLGVEQAWVPWLWARWRCRQLHNCKVLHGNLWSLSLASADVVYAFLSPAPMAALWCKVNSEMRPGSWMVSNSFAIPDVSPAKVIDVGQTLQTRLFCYELGRS
ncbi:MAG: methyltransferase [Pseudomonadales bacterium]|nr:methyltransferase [Pseudomonadales bacterium]